MKFCNPFIFEFHPSIILYYQHDHYCVALVPQRKQSSRCNYCPANEFPKISRGCVTNLWTDGSMCSNIISPIAIFLHFISTTKHYSPLAPPAGNRITGAQDCFFPFSSMLRFLQNSTGNAISLVKPGDFWNGAAPPLLNCTALLQTGDIDATLVSSETSPHPLFLCFP